MNTKIIFFSFLSLILGSANAQNFSLEGAVGVEDYGPFENGTTLYFSTLDIETSSYWFRIKNESDEPIELMAEFVSIDNADGTDVEFCIGADCFTSVGTGEPYFPVDPVPFSPGGVDESGKMWNFHPGINPDEPVTYVIKISEVNEDREFIGEPFIFTYVYSSSEDEDNLSISESAETPTLKVYPTVTTDLVNLETDEESTFTLFNETGQSVLSGQLQEGVNQISLASIAKGIYFITCQSATGIRQTMKIVKSE